MSPEAFVLALTAIVRPTSTVAVVAMLSTRRPQQLLAAYVLAGLVFSIGIGTLVVVVQQGFGTASSGDQVHEDVAWAKLQSLAEGARLASKQLWGRSD